MAWVRTRDLKDGCVTSAKLAEGAVSGSDLADKSVTTDKLGLACRNSSGSPIAAGALVYVTGYNASAGVVNISLADADVAGSKAVWVATAAIADATLGTVGKSYLITGVNTNGATVGDPVYLSTTAGGWTLSAPSGSSARVQIVGRVKVVHASTGQVAIDIAGEDASPGKVGSNDYQAGSVGSAALAASAVGSAAIAAQAVAPVAIANAAQITPVAPGASGALSATNVGVPIVIQLAVADGASGDATFTSVPYKMLITRVEYLKTGGAGNAGNSATLKNGASAITDAMNNASDTGTAYAATLDDAQTTVAANGTLVVTTVRAGGDNACIITVSGYRIA